MKLTKGKIIAALAVVLVLAGAFFLQGEDPAPAESSSAESQQQTDGNAQVEETPAAGEEPSQDAGVAADSGSQQENQSEKEEPVPETPVEEEKPQEQTPPQQSGETAPPEDPVVPAEPVAPEEPEKLTCTFSITCASVLDNMDKLTPGKEGLIPADGWLLAETEVEFSPGDTVFTVLQRELKSRNMHFEYSTAALYDTAYIEGICNLYEYDCGELSGWEYAVNGTFYGYGSSQFTLSDGDVVSWVYTCDLGADVGDGHRG